MGKKLIEVALPLDAINSASAKEKSIRHGHPSTLHLWWARRPLAAARAVIWSSLVDDPSAHPELFPTEDAQNAERIRLFKILEDLVRWENSNNEDILKAARNEILRSTNGSPPELLDPFAGGGAIPYEAQRLGLKANAHDLNPVAVVLNKSMIEIPNRFVNMAPVNPNDRVERLNTGIWAHAQGLAADIKFYAKRMKKEVFREMGRLYPQVSVPEVEGGGKATVIAWLWARTVSCPNPLCDCKIPLASSFVLSKCKGNEVWVKPIIDNDKVHFKVIKGKCPKGSESLKQGRSAIFKCPKCGEITQDKYMKLEGQSGRIGNQLMAIVAEGNNGRLYLSPDSEQENIAKVPRPDIVPPGRMPDNPRWFSPPAFGMDNYSDLFSSRQLLTLTSFSNMVSKTQLVIEKDALEAGYKDDHVPLVDGGTGAFAYSQAVGVYLALIIDKMADYHSTICTWNPAREGLRNTFSLQAIPMVWGYAEANPFSNSSGCFDNMVEWVYRCVENFSINGNGVADQFDAQEDCEIRDVMISTDPPYYDLVGFADLSDYFYIWLRNSLKTTYPNLFSTMLVPKAEELLASPYRYEGSAQKAKSEFESGMLKACEQLYLYSRDDVPVTIYYAYKENDKKEDGQSSSGWETILTAIIKAGFTITGTWPMRTERSGRFNANGTNSLASAIILVCRKRSKNAQQTTRRNLINELRKELRPALRKLQGSNIAPVDLAQSAIGPGMAVYSRYNKVLEANGSPMSVRNALQVINEEIDLYFNEQVGDFDAMSRFCVDLYSQNAFNEIKFGDADVLARAKGTSVASLSAHEVVYAKAGIVHLIERSELSPKIDNEESCIWMLTQQLTQAMATGGVEACAKAVFLMIGSNAERAKDLAYRLYTISEQKKWAGEAYAYNALVVAWPDIQSRAAMMQREMPDQMDMFSMGLLNS